MKDEGNERNPAHQKKLEMVGKEIILTYYEINMFLLAFQLTFQCVNGSYFIMPCLILSFVLLV